MYLAPEQPAAFLRRIEKRQQARGQQHQETVGSGAPAQTRPKGKGKGKDRQQTPEPEEYFTPSWAEIAAGVPKNGKGDPPKPQADPGQEHEPTEGQAPMDAATRAIQQELRMANTMYQAAKAGKLDQPTVDL